MVDSLFLLAALLFALLGMAWLALSIETNASRVMSTPLVTQTKRRLSIVLGAVAIILSAACCLMVNMPTMALLVWLMSLTFSAVIISVLLTYYPNSLKWLVSVW